MLGGNLVRLEFGGIDDHLEQFLPVALHFRCQDGRQCLDGILQVFGEVEHHAFGHAAFGAANEVYLDDREVAARLLQDDGLIGRRGKPGLGPVDGFAHIRQGLFQTMAGVEFDHDAYGSLVGQCTHFVDAADNAQFGLQRLEKEPFGVFRRDSLVRHRDHEERYIDVRFGFDGDRDSRADPGKQEECHHG